MGQQVRAARVRGSVNRQDLCVSWNKSLDKGCVPVGNTVTMDITVESTQCADAEACNPDRLAAITALSTEAVWGLPK